ncbi:hypothetical protein [Pseudonocardia sp. ICBG601]|uniref:hypothetical protein n=1 Tax=Pseudonocardia sp. ICBG601 TaxID=2846759 RepID=UPI001CF61792|nr:hypothetical protein [Pseudonocardia sp. ICBG601]
MGDDTEHAEDPAGGATGPDGASRVGAQTLADRINQAFKTLHPADRGPYSTREAVRWIEDHAGGDEPSISLNYLCSLRNGDKSNPTVKHLQALARFFQIPATYFLEDNEHADAVQTDLTLLEAMRDTEVQEIAARAIELDPSIRTWLRDTLRMLPETAESPAHRAWRRQFQVPNRPDVKRRDQA